jgi:hypothetical protein
MTNAEYMKAEKKASIEQLLAVAAGTVFLFFIVLNGANFLCQLNFYNTYIDDGFPANLAGESAINRFMAEKVYGGYSIRFNSSKEPLFMKAVAKYTAVPKTFDANASVHGGYYPLEPQPNDIIADLQKIYPSDLASLSNVDDLSYVHSGRQPPYSCLEHYYLIRNNKTNTNFFAIKRVYTGT